MSEMDNGTSNTRVNSIVRWVLTPVFMGTLTVAAILATWFFYFLVERFCPSSDFISGICFASYMPAVDFVALVIFSSLLVLSLILPLYYITPGYKRILMFSSYGICFLIGLVICVSQSSWAVFLLTMLVTGALTFKLAKRLK